MKGSDHAFSLGPVGLRKVVRGLTRIRVAIGDGVKQRLDSENAGMHKILKGESMNEHESPDRINRTVSQIKDSKPKDTDIMLCVQQVNERLDEIRKMLQEMRIQVDQEQNMYRQEASRLQKKMDVRLRYMELQVGAVLRLHYLQDVDLPFPQVITSRRFRVNSQNGEDGIILALFKRIGMTNCRFIDIGCGPNGGNSGFLAQEFGWSGLMVDAGDGNVRAAAREFSSSRVKVIKAWVTRENINSLIIEAGLQGEVDLVSIDIDGNDYWIWDALTVVSPRLVVIEYNSIFGPDKAVTVPYDSKFDRHKGKRIYYGASLKALTHQAERKGYRLVAVEPRGVNAFFLRNDVEPSVPACSVTDAFRLLDRTKDPSEIISEFDSPLVEVE